MNSIRKLYLALGIVGIIIPSCSLPLDHSVGQASPLTSGVRYELRKALSSKASFDPEQLKSTYFVLKPETPPAIAAGRTGAGGELAVRTTAYTHSELDHLVYGRLSAVGQPLRFGNVRSAAADWSRFPLGTRFRVRGQPGVIYQVDDYGSALVGSNTIDLYCPTRRQMVNWGVRTLDIQVIKWGSFEESLECMKDRVAFPHVRRMMREIQQQMTALAKSTRTTRDTPTTAMVAPQMLRRDTWAWSGSSL